PEFALISLIDASPHAAGTAYVAATRYKLDDFTPYLYKTSDYGQSWQRITNGIPADEFTRVIREDPNRKGLLYAGTEKSVYVSFDDGAHWQPFQQNLPVVPIHDLEIKGSDLIAATHGRGFWVVDDLTPIYQMQGGQSQTPVQLFQPRPTVQFKTNFGFGRGAATGNLYQMTGATMYTYRMEKNEQGEQERVNLDAGQNPPEGVVFRYSLAQVPEGEVELTISDGQGQEIRGFSSKKAEGAPEAKPMVAGESFEQMMEQAGVTEPEDKQEPKVPKAAGMNRFVWDMRYPGAVEVPGDLSMQFVGGSRGPTAPPGTYTVTLTVNGQSESQTFELVKDPRISATEEDLQAQFAFLLRVRDKLSQTNEAINRIRTVREQIVGWGKRLAGKESGQSVREIGKPLVRQLSEIEEQLIQVHAKSRQDTLNYPVMLNAKLAGLMRSAASAFARPTDQSYAVFDDLSKQVDAQLERLNNLLQSELPKFNQAVQQAQLPAVEAP
ncbi:MAG TPA: hypothetical protein VFI42_09855, partial [Thermomicrobiaceae bacterium]|nr:hypothetical protein [Thermomicrobiaceae bacterium]